MSFYPVAWWAIGGLIGARLLYVIEHLWTFVESPVKILAFSEGGVSVFGGFLVGAVAGWVMAVRAGSARRLPARAAQGWRSGRRSICASAM
ncbi:MAG: prolipoprotein diacylglyceryl transferase family protein [Thermomicrobiales bacterium]